MCVCVCKLSVSVPQHRTTRTARRVPRMEAASVGAQEAGGGSFARSVNAFQRRV